MKISDEKIKYLAGKWGKDVRTIKRWIKKGNPMLTHPDSQKIINAK